MKNESIEKEKKAGSPLFIIFIFVVLIAIVNYAPKMYQKYNSHVSSNPQFKNDEKKNSEDSDVSIESESSFYTIGESQNIAFNEINLSDVFLNGFELSFIISTDGTISLDSKNYYLELYDAGYSFKTRRILKGNVNKSENLKVDLSNIDVSNLKYAKLVHIEDSSIPNVNFNTDESGIFTIMCTKGSNSYAYDFELNKLIKVVRQFTYAEENLEEYASKKLEYQKQVNSDNKIEGITADIADSGTTFIYTVEVDLDKVDENNLNDVYFYKKDMKANIIKYKLEAEGFVCTQK